MGSDSDRSIVIQRFRDRAELFGRVFLVTGKDSFESSGARKCLKRVLNWPTVCRFSDFTPNPKSEDVQRGIMEFKVFSPDNVVAVGGGSVIDMAKLINYFATNEIGTCDYIAGKRGTKQGKPLIAIPTTAGSGSEVTSFAVMYVDRTKYSVDQPSLLPNVAVVDPYLTESLPSHITAATGMDALGQAIESYWSVNSTGISKQYASQAIRLAISNLTAAVNRSDISARRAMAEAAHLAGKAINITRTTAPHAISYPLTAYFGVPHGHAVGLTLSCVLDYNSRVCEADLQDPRGCDYVRRTLDEIAGLLGHEDVGSACQGLDHLMEQIGLPSRLSELGVESEGDLECIVANGCTPARMKNNPRSFTVDSLRQLLLEIW